MSDLQKGNLITSVDVSATNVKRNKPVLVKVKLAATAAKAYVRINGQSGLTRYVQFPRKGKQKVSVYVQLGKVYDEREVEVTVAELAANERHTPHVLVRRDPLETYAAWLSVANAKRFSSPNRQFKWTLSDGRTLTTRDQEIKVSFKDVIDHTKPFTEFTVDVHDVSDPAKSKGQQIVRVWSHYYMLKETKRKAMPTAVALKPVVGAGGNVDLKVEVKNVETQALNFNQLILEFMRGGNVNQPAEKPVAISFVVPAKAKATFSYTVAKSMIPADAIGVAINLIGPAAGALPELHAAAFAELPNAPVEAYAVKDPVLLNQIKALAAGNATTITLDKLNTDLLRSVKKPGALEKITIRQMALSPSGATEATSVIGQPCQPTDAAPAGVYCALTEEMEWVWTPAMIMNARKGDVILSAGGPSGVVGGVLSNVTPAQQYSHSGIMTQNYTEVRHSTASEDYLIDKLQAENLTSNNGFNPFHLKYMWPGTITQTVTDAFFGQDFVGPDGNGKTYRLTGFQHNSNFDTELNIVPPMVVKPSPVLEQPGNWIRPLLHAIAESAKQINGHYRLYAYTDAAISIKPEFNAPALTPSGKTWWGANTVATVCSSLVWTAIQRLNWTKMGIEGKPGFLKFSDLEPQENNVAMVDAQTRDGLYLYTKAERYAAAKWLRDKIHEIVDEMASEKATDEGGAIFTWLADNKDEIAFQVLNTFALDKTDRVNGDTPSWYKNQDPNVGRAVSPDDIMRFWDAPHAGPDNTIIGLYGHAEQLVLRPAQWQLRKVHRWAPVQGPKVTVKGTVTRLGQRIGGALIKWSGNEFGTNSNGEFTIQVAPGSYSVQAGKVMDGWYYSETKAVTVPANQPNFTVNFELKPPSDANRLLTVTGTMDVSDYETIGKNEHKHFDLEPKQLFILPPGIGQSTGTIKYVKSMGGEIRVEVVLNCSYVTGGDIKVDYDVKFFEGATESTTDLEMRERGSFIVAKNQAKDWLMHVWNKDEDEKDDNASIRLRLANVRQA